MIINDKDAAARLSSPMNLINRLKETSSPAAQSRKSAMSLFIPPKIEVRNFNPFVSPSSSNLFAKQATPTNIPEEASLEDILENHEAKINLGLAHDNAIKLLNSAVNALSIKLEDVKADKLPAVISAASKTVESIRRERNEANKNNKDREVHYHFYTPQQNKLTDYEVIDVA